MLVKVAVQRKNQNMRIMMMNMMITDARKILHATWKSLAQPIKEDILKEDHYAVIYIDPKNNKNRRL